MAEALAFLHWLARIDGNKIKFLLGLPRKGDTRIAIDFASPSMTLGDHRLWTLDFDQCVQMPMNEQALVMASEAILNNPMYYPQAKTEDPTLKVLWEVFRNRYLAASEWYLANECDKVKGLPERIMQRVWDESRGHDWQLLQLPPF